MEKINLYQKENTRISEIASSAKYRIDEQFQNCVYLELNFDFIN